MKLTAKQTEAYLLATSGKKKIILYGGAIRGGKTYWLILTFASLCSKYPKSRWVIVRESLPTLKRTTFVTLNQVMEQGLGAHVISNNRDTNTITFKNGSQIIFMAESFSDDPELNRFRGLEVNGGGGDELNELQQETFYKLIERAGSWNQSVPQPPITLLFTCNPSQGWVKEQFYDRYINNKLPEDWAYIPAKITDNPYTDPAYIQNLKENMPADLFQKFVEGDWDITKVINPFASEYDYRVHEDRAVRFDPSKQLIIHLDFNTNPFAISFSHCWADAQGGVHDHQFDEAEIYDGNIPKGVALIKARYANKLRDCLLTGDAIGYSLKDMSGAKNLSYYQQLKEGLGLMERQIVTPDSNPSHHTSRSDVNYLLKHHPDFKINPLTCPRTCADMRTVQCDSLGQIIKGSRKNLTRRADFLDTVRYKINSFWKEWIIKHQKVAGIRQVMENIYQ